jgi:hypothetical protein
MLYLLTPLVKLLILAAVAAPDSRPHHPDAVEVFDCDFSRSWDVNYDNWPDKWQRVFGPGMPRFIQAEVEEDSTAASGHCLKIKVNGGGALVHTPCAGVSDNFSYEVESRLRVTGLKYARAQVRLEFCDENKTVLQTAEGPWITSTHGWLDLHIGPINPANPDICLAQVSLIVEPGQRADLNGEVALDGVWMGRLPKMTVTTNSPFNVYTNKDDIEVTCALSGILDSDPVILFELLDASSQQLRKDQMQLEGKLINEHRSRVSDIIKTNERQQSAYAGSTTWRPPIYKDGFYKIRVTMETAEGRVKQDLITVALAPPLNRPAKGEFGWSLAGNEVPLDFEQLSKLLPRVAINWVKMPVWYSPKEVERGEQFITLAERLSAEDIEVVGVVDRPPADSELANVLRPESAIVDILSADSASWLPLLDPVMTRLSMKVRWWQLGGDYDASLDSIANLETELLNVREKLFRFGQEVNVGLAWTWNHLSAGPTAASWQFEQYFATPGLTSDELGAYLDAPGRDGVRRWVLVEPLSKKDYDLETRARDLVEQMLQAKIHGADAIFVAKPFDDDRGLMTRRGTPSELLLPWRTTASLLSAAKYLGSIQLPEKSHSRLFQSPSGDVVMVVWSDQPAKELIYLGDDVRVLDVWGREHKPEERDNQQLIEVEPLPRFIVGVNPHIARWRIGVKFGAKRVPSVFGESHPNKLLISNAFPQGVSGTVELVAPEGWQMAPARIDFKLSANEMLSRPFDVSLPFDASSGVAPVRADFVVDADRQYRFSVYRELNVGDGEIELETNTRLEDDGWLVIEQRMLNHGGVPVDFKCLLYAPGRRTQRTQVIRLSGSPDVKIYRYPDGAQLLGKELWLRVQEVDGSRVLNHRFVIQQ